MLLSSVIRHAAPALLGLCVACDPCKTGEEPEVHVTGAPVCEYTPSQGDAVGIYLAPGDEIQAVQWQGLGHSAASGEARAVLTNEALQILEEAASFLGSGGEVGAFSPACFASVDSPRARVHLAVSQSRLSFGYPWGCPPPSLVEVDELCSELVGALPSCASSPYFEDCEVID